MWIFLVAGLLYLAGVAAILIIKPAFMFTPDGAWKEFGIGKKPESYTTFPFWMFCIVWAFVSFSIVMVFQPSSDVTVNVPLPELNAPQIPQGPVELPKGYYVLNKKATALSGVPKYVYLGQEEP